MVEDLDEVDDWFTLGVSLGVPVNRLREFTQANSRRVPRCKIDVFHYWLNSTPTASWINVTRVLEQLNYITLAAKLKSKYLRNSRQQPSGAEGTHTFVVNCVGLCVAIVSA